MNKTLIIGATSAIAEAVARQLAARRESLYLVARRQQQLEAMAADLSTRGANRVGFEVLDMNNLGEHEAMLERADTFLGGFNRVLIAHGTLSDQKSCEASVELTLSELHTNALSVVAVLTRLANRLAPRRTGVIAVISSVAGDRGRASNYVYGSAKALVTAFTSGLRQRLRPHGVAVVTIKPGLVDTPMTAAFRKGAMWASRESVASGIIRSLDRGGALVYLPGYWRPIMFVIRMLPEAVFGRLRI